MCGIVGICDTKNQQSITKRTETVKKMNAAIRHRGPDETGFYADAHCALAMSRLSIIDLEQGKQPIYNWQKTIGVFFNGEIYNYLELKKDLISQGHSFSTNSDTEVLVVLYEVYGKEMVKYLRGMFAFCIYEVATQTYFFARDSFGEKPFFYHFNDGVFSFASEIKALLENSDIPRKINYEALPYYLAIAFVPEPITLLEGVFTLPPGHSLTLANGKMKIEKYFHINYETNHAIKTDKDAIDFIKPYLQTAVKRQMVSDVPIGAFLSGGIDSSSVVANMQQMSSSPINTFTVKFEEASYDESGIAREVAKRLGTNHHEIVLPNATFTSNIFWTIIDHVGMPFPDSSAIPTFYISKEIKKHVTVALSGDGGDELFAGYPVFEWHRKILALKQIPAVIRNMTGSLLDFSTNAPLLNKSSRLRQINRAFRIAQFPKKQIALELERMFEDYEIENAWHPNGTLQNTHSNNYDLLTSLPENAKNWTSLRKNMHFRLKHILQHDMLVKVDRMSMAASLEVRAPFLDIDLFEASAQLPDKFLINKGVGKYIIREAMKHDLPESVFNHPKTGFSIPLYAYQNNEFKELMHSLLSPENPMYRLFNPAYIEQLKQRGIDTKIDNAQISAFKATHQLWSMMQLFGWAIRFNVSL